MSFRALLFPAWVLASLSRWSQIGLILNTTILAFFPHMLPCFDIFTNRRNHSQLWKWKSNHMWRCMFTWGTDLEIYKLKGQVLLFWGPKLLKDGNTELCTSYKELGRHNGKRLFFWQIRSIHSDIYSLFTRGNAEWITDWWMDVPTLLISITAY